MDAYPNKIRFVYKQFPLSFHQNARSASETAVFAKEHGKFWEMHELIFQNNQAMNKNTPEQIMEIYKGFAKQLGLDDKSLEDSVKKQAFKAVIDKDLADGQKAGVQGTPTVFINGKRLPQRNFETIKGMIDAILGSSGGGQPAGR